jgi:hypothetical protein
MMLSLNDGYWNVLAPRLPNDGRKIPDHTKPVSVMQCHTSHRIRRFVERYTTNVKRVLRDSVNCR